MTDTEIVLVHGLWFRAWAMRWLARQMRGLGFRVRWFSYPTTRVALEDSARELLRLCQESDARQTHLLGHSLGGLLILLMTQHQEWRRPGRLLLMGTPLNGSAVARRAADWPGSDFLFGQARTLLTGGALHWPADREVGMIAGTTPVGLGRITGGLETPHDGTVSVAETRHPRLSAHLELPVSHTSMLRSRRVAERAAEFLWDGRFSDA